MAKRREPGWYRKLANGKIERKQVYYREPTACIVLCMQPVLNLETGPDYERRRRPISTGQPEFDEQQQEPAPCSDNELPEHQYHVERIISKRKKVCLALYSEECVNYRNCYRDQEMST